MNLRGFLNVLFWEFVQNLPLLLAFTAAVWWWAHGERWKSVAAVAGGAVVTALVIALTEAWKIMDPSYVEPPAVIAINVAGIAIFTMLFTLYLGTEARWSSWRTDLLLGALAGAAFALMQAAGAPGIWIVAVLVHGVALALAGALVLVGMRFSKARSLRAALLNAVGLAAAMTLVITLLDYAYVLLGLQL